jgi:hypothetical protein
MFLFLLLFQSNLTHLPRSEFLPGIGLGIAKCPYDPLDNSTAVFVEHGNPGDFPALVGFRRHFINQLIYIIIIFLNYNLHLNYLKICSKII